MVDLLDILDHMAMVDSKDKLDKCTKLALCLTDLMGLNRSQLHRIGQDLPHLALIGPDWP